MTRLSCHRFRSNEVRLWLSVIAYHLGNLWRLVSHRPGRAGVIRTLSIAGSSGVFIRWWSISATSHCSKRRSEPHGFIL
jgi:hypothetical protein